MYENVIDGRYLHSTGMTAIRALTPLERQKMLNRQALEFITHPKFAMTGHSHGEPADGRTI